jgi:hypothetical protein
VLRICFLVRRIWNRMLEITCTSRVIFTRFVALDRRAGWIKIAGAYQSIGTDDLLNIDEQQSYSMFPQKFYAMHDAELYRLN